MALWGLTIVSIGLFGLFARRRLDLRADRAEMARLSGFQPTDPPRFSADMVADLPEPARRFFTFAIAEGTPLYTVARRSAARPECHLGAGLRERRPDDDAP